MKARRWPDKVLDVPLRERLLEAVPIAVPEVRRAFLAWTAVVKNSVLIGALAAGVYGKPRTTMDVDMLFLSKEAVPLEVPDFKRLRAHAFAHHPTKVEVKVLTPAFLKMPEALARKIFETTRSGVASAEGVVAAKLQRGSLQDQGDIEEILHAHPEVTLEGWPVAAPQRSLFDQIKREVAARVPLGD